MKKLALSLATICGLSTPGLAQDDNAFVTFQVLKPEVAQQMAEAALLSCREAGYQIWCNGG